MQTKFLQVKNSALDKLTKSKSKEEVEKVQKELAL